MTLSLWWGGRMTNTLTAGTDTMIETIVKKCGEIGLSVAMTGKIVLQCSRSHRPCKTDCPQAVDNNTIIILGNGPSLRRTLADHADILEHHRLMAVNFAANTCEFQQLRPCDYVLADPHFYAGKDTDGNVQRLWENLMKTDWPMQLHVPVKYRAMADDILKGTGIIISSFSMIPATGLEGVARVAMKHRMAMPRPRNVMIPALMQAIHCGYKTVILAGADHTWTRTLSVDENNCVVNFQTHFYADSKSEHNRQAQCHTTVHLHDILESMAIAFRSYHEVAAYAAHCRTAIYNATPDTFIDAFPRLPLPAAVNSE